jgi:glucose/arabinose dehydrogenase
MIVPIHGAGARVAAQPAALLLAPVGSFNYPTYVTSPPGDQHRLFVTEQPGVVKLVLDGAVQSTPFLDVTSLVDFDGNERGFFSIAFPPDYATSGLFYVYYTAAGTGAMTIDEFQRSAGDPNVADPLSRRNVITVPHPSQSNHNGGQLQFGPDGMLYLGTGDGGGGGDPFRSAQNLADRRGKIMRIDPRQDGANAYRVPPNNPFVDLQNAAPEIWSFGLRNPWRFSFDRLNGDLNVGDVGQNEWEEIDYQPVGLGWGNAGNFGWSCFEGRHAYNSCQPPPVDPISPVFEYSHASRCTVIGGYVVHDTELPMLAGQYVYADLCDGLIRAQTLAIPDSQGDHTTGLSVNIPSSFGEDACGHVYVAGVTPQGSANVFRLEQTDAPPPNCVPAFPLPEITGTVGPGFTISMNGPDGQPLETIPEGAYTLHVSDLSDIHNFHLLGPKVSCVPTCATSLVGQGDETWTVNFTPGTVVYQCDAHGQMYGSFTVTGQNICPCASHW